MIKLLLLATLLGGTAMTSTPRTTYLPLLRMNAPDPLRPADLRIDNIDISKLDEALRKFGIPAPQRKIIIDQETERRQQPPEQPQETAAYPSPNATGLWVGTQCTPGQGCMMTWKCAGTCTSQWFEISGGPTEWTQGLPCPRAMICTILSRAASIQIPRHHWIAFRGYSGVAVPIYIIWTCFWTA